MSFLSRLFDFVKGENKEKITKLNLEPPTFLEIREKNRISYPKFDFINVGRRTVSTQMGPGMCDFASATVETDIQIPIDFVQPHKAEFQQMTKKFQFIPTKIPELSQDKSVQEKQEEIKPNEALHQTHKMYTDLIKKTKATPQFTIKSKEPTVQSQNTDIPKQIENSSNNTSGQNPKNDTDNSEAHPSEPCFAMTNFKQTKDTNPNIETESKPCFAMTNFKQTSEKKDEGTTFSISSTNEDKSEKQSLHEKIKTFLTSNLALNKFSTTFNTDFSQPSSISNEIGGFQYKVSNNRDTTTKRGRGGATIRGRCRSSYRGR